jgi:hypothetical protein
LDELLRLDLFSFDIRIGVDLLEGEFHDLPAEMAVINDGYNPFERAQVFNHDEDQKNRPPTNSFSNS